MGTRSDCEKRKKAYVNSNKDEPRKGRGFVKDIARRKCLGISFAYFITKAQLLISVVHPGPCSSRAILPNAPVARTN